MSTQNSRLSASKIRAILRRISKTEPGTIRAAVADEALASLTGDPCQMFTDLACHGCQSGMINSLIYYVDTRGFFDTHYAEIEDLREEVEDELGEPLVLRRDLKTNLAWFGFEETAIRMAREDLGLNL